MDWVNKPQNYKDYFVWNFATFVRFPFEPFSAENWPGSFSFRSISVEMFRFSI